MDEEEEFSVHASDDDGSLYQQDSPNTIPDTESSQSGSDDRQSNRGRSPLSAPRRSDTRSQSNTQPGAVDSGIASSSRRGAPVSGGNIDGHPVPLLSISDWTISGLQRVLSSRGVSYYRTDRKADLFAAYLTSLRSERPRSSSASASRPSTSGQSLARQATRQVHAQASSNPPFPHPPAGLGSASRPSPSTSPRFITPATKSAVV